jgi:hypothetical protein
LVTDGKDVNVIRNIVRHPPIATAGSTPELNKEDIMTAERK